MFRTIVLALDGSAQGSVAMRQSAELASLCKAELHLLGIVLTTGFMALAEGLNGTADLWAMERETLTRALAAATAEIASSGVVIVSSIQEGDPADMIFRYAQSVKADLVVIGHSGQGILSRWLVGSVGGQLLHNLPCSLLIVAPQA